MGGSTSPTLAGMAVKLLANASLSGELAQKLPAQTRVDPAGSTSPTLAGLAVKLLANASLSGELAQKLRAQTRVDPAQGVEVEAAAESAAEEFVASIAGECDESTGDEAAAESVDEEADTRGREARSRGSAEGEVDCDEVATCAPGYEAVEEEVDEEAARKARARLKAQRLGRDMIEPQ